MGLKASDSPVVRGGGDYGAGLIKGLAVVTRGEALGHEMWIDQTFVEQTAKAVAASKMGIKARFTHPGLSSDGMGKFLGRIKAGRVDGDIARADLHLAKSAQNTPDGDLADYVMSLAEEDPAAFATSIVFDHDMEAEEAFAEEHKGEEKRFSSPDKDNVANYLHARLKNLYADDVVDEPAANPGGLFHRGDEIAAEADDLLSYALGLTTEKPELSQLEIDPDRVSGFVSRFLKSHGLSVVTNKEADSMADEKTGVPAPDNKPDNVDLGKERVAALRSKYGTDPAFVLEMFESGASMAEAETAWLKKETAKYVEELAALKAENEALKKAAPKAEPKPVGAKPVEFTGEQPTDGGDFMQTAKALAAEKKLPLHQAMSRVAKEQPELHAAYVESCRVSGKRS